MAKVRAEHEGAAGARPAAAAASPPAEARVDGHVDVVVDVAVDRAAPAFDGGTLRVRLEDVTVADAKAPVLDQSVIEHVARAAGEEHRIPVRLRAAGMSPGRRYGVRAHLALHGGGDVRVGDYVTQQSYPVTASGGPAEVRLIRVQ